jgi:O-antigen ligase
MNLFPYLLGVFVGLLFCQLWWDVAGFTIRAEDVLALILLGVFFLRALLSGKLRLIRNFLNLPLLAWGGVLGLGVMITLLSPFDNTTHKDALVNGVRLILAIGMFFVVSSYKIPAKKKLKATVISILGVSLATTAVAVLQIAYWDSILPVRLPEVLITFREGANTEKGREIFALYIGDTGSHTWSGMLAMQTLLVWLIGRYAKKPCAKIGAFLYFGLMVLILVRISVRNSIMGLLIAIAGIEVLRGPHLIGKTLRVIEVAIVGALLVYILLYTAPDTYFIERIRQVIPRFEENGLSVQPGSNIYGRLDYWAVALKIFASAPLTGTGFYTYRVLSGYFLPGTIAHAHNSFFHTLAEFGIIGVLVMGWLVASVIYYLYCIRYCFGQLTTSIVFWWEFVAGSLLFSVFVSLFDNHLYLPTPIAFRLVALGILVSLASEQCKAVKIGNSHSKKEYRPTLR